MPFAEFKRLAGQRHIETGDLFRGFLKLLFPLLENFRDAVFDFIEPLTEEGPL
ncbi:hypothetical protein D3C83_299210 [compost metagenome]